MEKIKVNMSPNPLDVQTIHASQNDGEARQWEFELHNNGELIDTSEITEQMFFKAYKGGTEQLLPENTSTPTTSPFLGDIRYPQGLLTDQEFTYRQSPTEEDGLAKITDIKGNTLVWNQFVQNGNFADTSGWSSGGNRGTLSANNNELSYTIAEIGTSTELNRIQRSASFTQNHIYLLMFDFYALRNGTMRGILGGSQNVRGRQIPCVSGWNKYADILTANSTNTTAQGCFSAQTDYSVGEVVKWRNFMLIDLTQMGLDITEPSEFTSLFSLPYYSYNQGSLLSFMGNGIKTVGKNLVFKTISNSSINGSGAIISTSNFQMSVARVIKGKEYVITTNDNSKKVLGFYYEEPVVGSVSYNGERVDDSSSYTFTSPITGYVAFRSLGGYSTPMLEFGSTATSYEPYTTSTLSLPVSTYFPNGMKSAGNVYDELTPIKATNRIAVRTWNGTESFDITNTRTNTIQFARGVSPSANPANADTVGNVVSSLFLPNSLNNVYSQDIEGIGIDTTGRIRVTILKSRLSSADVHGFKSWLTSNNLTFYYELATPTETSFTTASLVTENAEIPLSNEDGVLIGKCTEQLSENPGFFDGKIKLADGDGECYSNKIQLHIERSPQ